ncbi:MAG: hypothetical protein HYX92_04115 [Chloroflexi bacterium]|nr:hypothetical protein [Chloroflexota bacterium]
MADIIEALEPTAEVKRRPQRAPNPFPTDLRGKTVGFLNGDGGGQHARIDSLFRRMERLLEERYTFGEVVYRQKFRNKSGQGATEETLNELAARADLVISGVAL